MSNSSANHHTAYIHTTKHYNNIINLIRPTNNKIKFHDFQNFQNEFTKCNDFSWPGKGNKKIPRLFQDFRDRGNTVLMRWHTQRTSDCFGVSVGE